MRVVLVIMMLLIAGSVQAQCIAEVTDVTQDDKKGMILVHTQYTLNGQIVQNGRSRHTEQTGTKAEIIVKAKEAGERHCKNLIKRMANNKVFIDTERVKRQKELTATLVTDIKVDLVGYKSKSIEDATVTYKGKDIKVTYDEKNTVSDTVITP